jgi:hypothetical protein
MSTVDNMSTFRVYCISDLVEFCGIALMLLAAPMKCYGCGGVRAAVLPVLFF